MIIGFHLLPDFPDSRKSIVTQEKNLPNLFPKYQIFTMQIYGWQVRRRSVECVKVWPLVR